jgi:CDP-diacylglycerol---serine O-phosphatidyltransferase
VTTGPLSAFHPANALTYASLLSAVAAIAAALHENAAAAGALIALSVIADTFDGRFARLFRRSADERTLGAQLDSLSDAIAFGATPCVCMMLLAPRASGWTELVWWIAFAAFAACTIARLAFYNVTQEVVDGFVGLPAPVAALIWSTALLLHPAPLVSSIVLFASAAAMVLPIHVPRPSGAGLALFAAWPILVLLTHVQGSGAW